jgi:outer membrane receptor for ferrienterochelin and colicins
VVVADGFLVGEATVRIEAGELARYEVVLQPAFGEEMVVTARRAEQRLADVPVHIQVLDRRQIESSVARTLADAVEWTSGVRVESNCQNCNFSQVRMLGLQGPYTQVLVDGQPTVSALAMVYGIEQIPARLIDGIEVVKGGGSAVYGAGAVGGVINLIPHQPSHTGFEVESRAAAMEGEEGGSLAALGDWASTDRSRSVTAFGQIDRVPAVDVDGDGFSEVTRRRLEAFGLRFEQFLLDDRGRFSLELNRTHEGRRGGDRLHLPPHRAAIAEEIVTERRGGTAGWLHTVSPRLDYRLALSFSGTERASYYGAGFDPNAYGATDNPLWIADLQFNRYRGNHTLTWGLQASRDAIEDVQLGYGRVIEARYTSVGLFVQEDRRLAPRLTALVGARVDHHSEVDEPILSPRAALLWSPTADVTLRASVAAGFRPPVVFDEDLHIALVGGGGAQVVRNAPELEEESSRSSLLGAEWRPTFGRKGALALEANLFRTELDGLFHRLEADDPTTVPLELVRVNFGGAAVEGLELAAAFRWGSRLAGEVGYTVQSARFDRREPDFGSREFFRTPESYGMATLQWSAPRGVELFAGALYTGSMIAPHYAGAIAEDRLESTPSFVTFDGNVSRAFRLGEGEVGRLIVTLGGRNLTGAYQEDLDRGPDRDPSYVYGPRFPRSWFAALKVEL